MGLSDSTPWAREGEDSRPIGSSGRAASTSPYASNAFRVLGLHVRATQRDVRRRAQHRRLLAELRGDDQAELEQIRAAVATLEDPARRLREELYWVHLSPDPVPAALDLSDRAMVRSVGAALARLAEDGSDEALHDLAVVGHAWLIESGDADARRWSVALARWRAVWANDAYWSRLGLLAADATVVAALVERRNELPGRVLAPSAGIVAQLLEEGRDADAVRHYRSIVESGFPIEAIQQAGTAATAALCARIGSTIHELRALLRTGQADNLRAAWATVARDLITPVERLRQVDADGVGARAVYDEAATLLRSLGTRLHNVVADDEAAVSALEASERLAGSESVRRRASENLRILRLNGSVKRAEAHAQQARWEPAIAELLGARALANAEERPAVDGLIAYCRETGGLAGEMAPPGRETLTARRIAARPSRSKSLVDARWWRGMAIQKPRAVAWLLLPTALATVGVIYALVGGSREAAVASPPLVEVGSVTAVPTGSSVDPAGRQAASAGAVATAAPPPQTTAGPTITMVPTPRPGVAANVAPATSPPVAGGLGAVVPNPQQPSPAAPPTLRTLLDERFAGGRGSWPDDPRSTAWFADRAYRLSAPVGRFVAIGAPLTEPLGEVVVSGTFRKIGGPPGGGYGLIVRDQGPWPRDGVSQDGRYYVLEAGDRGEVGIWRRDGDRWVDLLPWTRSPAVRPGDAANELMVRASGPRLTFLVNGTQVADVHDPTLAEGRVGVFVGGDLNQVVLERFVVQVPR